MATDREEDAEGEEEQDNEEEGIGICEGEKHKGASAVTFNPQHVNVLVMHWCD